MRSPLAKLYVHVVWATWDRLPFITPEIEPRVYGEIVEKARTLKTLTLAVGGMPDHVHLLVRLPATLAVAELVQGVKGASSHLVAQVLTPNEFFKWQGAYGAFTLAEADVNRCINYIRGQKQHHAGGQLDATWEMTEPTDAPDPDDQA